VIDRTYSIFETRAQAKNSQPMRFRASMVEPSQEGFTLQTFNQSPQWLDRLKSDATTIVYLSRRYASRRMAGGARSTVRA
jgi:hypothetical protein